MDACETAEEVSLPVVVATGCGVRVSSEVRVRPKSNLLYSADRGHCWVEGNAKASILNC